jgi:phosphoglycolate phosphatase-like HAD superfamily hydrolase
MQIIEGVLLEPVGCLAEFGGKEFTEILASFYGQKKKTGKSGSDAYWHLLHSMQSAEKKLSAADDKAAEALEIAAVDNANVYEDVGPALDELRGMGIKLFIASSLSEAAVNRFLQKSSLKEYFSAVWKNRTNAGGVMAAPLTKALASAGMDPERVMSLADTEEGLNLAKDVGVNSILLINDYDEGRRLAMHPPTGGIVSLAELPDAIRFVAENAKRI